MSHQRQYHRCGCQQGQHEYSVHVCGQCVWLNAAPGNQELMLRADPERFFYPPYVGKGGWIGVYLDGKTDWKGLAGLIEDSWRLSAPRRLLKEMAGRP